MIIGADLSSYDGSDGTVVDPYDFVILNVQDPTISAKLRRAKEKGIPWGLYTWVYPGGGNGPIVRAQRIIDDYGTPPKGVWLDYEQAGVTPSDLTAALIAGEGAGMDIGVYTYLAVLPSVQTLLRGHPLWLAFYPYPNNGTYPGGAAEKQARDTGAKLWQFTSSNGTRDLNVVLDEAWWNEWGTGEEVTREQMEELGRWMKEQRELLEQHLGQWEWDTRKIVLDAINKDNDALAQAIVDKLPENSGGGITKDDVRDALKEVLRSV